MILDELKESGEAPHWLTSEGYKTLSKGYLLKGETPKGMYTRVSKSAANRLNKPELESKFFDIIWKNWLCLASPVASNMGTERGLPISCNSIHVGDNLDNILMKNHELGMLSKYGAGVGIYLGDLRSRGSDVKGTGGTSDGVVSWAKIYDSTIASVNQGATRRGAAAVYLPVDHGDIQEFLQIRKPTGDMNKRCMNLHQGVCLPDEFMQSLVDGHTENRAIYSQLLTSRFETGEPYLFFPDNVNRQNPACYTSRGLIVKTSNICTEIMLYTDQDHTFVCCLSSMNLARWHEWKDTDTVQLSMWFLDAVMEEYIQKAKSMRGFESSVRFAIKSRAVGLGVLGWHSLLQELRIPFESLEASILNNLIFKHMHTETEMATAKLAEEYGEPEWCTGFGRRNSHCMAVAPTVSNSLISGGLSAGIEPWSANIFVQNSAKGTFVIKNKHLERFLQEKGIDTPEVWNQINKDAGSILNVKGMTKEEKSIFLTAKEINQFAIVRQAAQRQKWVDQGQSVNLFFAANSDPKYVHEVHMEAWKLGLKSLYYCRTESVLRADLATRTADECVACEA